MRSHADATVTIQTSAEAVLSPPSWFGEVVLLARYLKQQGVLEAINERVRGCHDGALDETRVIDIVVVLFGYEILGERRLPAFYQRLQPFADPFMALFGRDWLPVRSTLSRDFSALTSEPVDTLRSLFLDDLRETAHSRKKSKRVVWRIERETRGWSLRSTARARQPESLRCPRQKRCPRLFGDWMTSVLLARLSASAGKWCVPARSSVRLTAFNGSARLAIEGTGATERNCARPSPRSCAISRHTNSSRNVLSSGSTDNMAPGPCSPIWLDSRS